MHQNSARRCKPGEPKTGLWPRFYFLFRNVRQRTERDSIAVKNKDQASTNNQAKGSPNE
jgi:hypothetical protein